MSEINHMEPLNSMETPELTNEQIAALEAERQAALEAELAPFRALKERIDALVEINETILNP